MTPFKLDEKEEEEKKTLATAVWFIINSVVIVVALVGINIIISIFTISATKVLDMMLRSTSLP